MFFPIMYMVCIQNTLFRLASIDIYEIKGKGSQKYTWILFKSICITEHFEANCMEIGYLLL